MSVKIKDIKRVGSSIPPDNELWSVVEDDGKPVIVFTKRVAFFLWVGRLYRSVPGTKVALYDGNESNDFSIVYDYDKKTCSAFDLSQLLHEHQNACGLKITLEK